MGVNWEHKTSLVNELTQGRELARQLQMHLNVASNSNPSTTTQTALARELLIQKIIASYEKALTILNTSSYAPIAVAVEQQQQQQQQPTFTVAASTGVVTIRMADSPPSLNGSPRSEDSDDHKDPSRKRLVRT